MLHAKGRTVNVSNTLAEELEEKKWLLGRHRHRLQDNINLDITSSNCQQNSPASGLVQCRPLANTEIYFREC
jgi:hypothetical protein